MIYFKCEQRNYMYNIYNKIILYKNILWIYKKYKYVYTYLYISMLYDYMSMHIFL